MVLLQELRKPKENSIIQTFQAHEVDCVPHHTRQSQRFEDRNSRWRSIVEGFLASIFHQELFSYHEELFVIHVCCLILEASS